MKYTIAESQIDKVIFKYLDNQDFIQIEKKNSIYFMNSEGDEYYQIIFTKNHGNCYINPSLVYELSDFFGFKDSYCEDVIGRWVENILQMEVKDRPKKVWSKNIFIVESASPQSNLISELERHWMDFEYEEQYNRLKNKLVSFIVSMIDSYEDRFGEIVLFDSNDNIVMVFKPHSENNRNGSLYYDRSFVDSIEGMFPHPIWARHGQYAMADAFSQLYPEYIVRSSKSANIS